MLEDSQQLIHGLSEALLRLTPCQTVKAQRFKNKWDIFRGQGENKRAELEN